MNLSPVCKAIAGALGGLRQYRAPGFGLAQVRQDHPIATTSRIWLGVPYTSEQLRREDGYPRPLPDGAKRAEAREGLAAAGSRTIPMPAAG